MNEILAHSIRQIGEVPLKMDPFPHFVLEKIFPDEFYQELIEMLPDQDHYLPSKYNLQTWSFDLDDEKIDQLPFLQLIFWKKFSHMFSSPSLIRAVMEKFQPHLEEKLEHLSSGFHLALDRAGYSLGPHTDHPAKVATLLFYLPRSDKQVHLGTSLYLPKERGFKCKGLHRYPFKDFEHIGRAPFLPNSLFAFFKTDDSFHGVEPMGPQEEDRHLISYTIWNSLLN